MEHLYLPPSLRYFVPPRVEQGTPGAHACFEYDLVAAKRPEMVVDLGSGDGMSFSVFCQSMRDHEVDGLAYAIDTWANDEGEGEATWTALNNFLHSNFRGFAYLLKHSPEEALSHFADRSVDLLRIDARRVDRPLLQVLDAWSPKLKAESVVLCAGLAENSDVLAAWKGRTPHGLVLRGGGGLGASVHEVASTMGSDFLPLASSNDDADRERWGTFYEHAALHHALRFEVMDHGGALYRKRA